MRTTFTSRRRLPSWPLLAGFFMGTLLAAGAHAEDWPQWRGPQRDGISAESIPVWNQPPPVVWEFPVGEGHSSVIVAEGRVFSMYKVENDEVVLCLDAKSGKELWSFRYRAPFTNAFGNGPRSTPTWHAGKLFTLGATGDLYCLDAKTGTVVWNLNLLGRFDASNLFFGTSTSPLVVEDLLLVMAGGMGAGVVAFESATGHVRWTSQDDRASYASPILFRGAADPQAIFLTQQGLLALRPVDGKALWRLPLVTFNDENSCTPLAVGDLVVGTSVSYGSVAMRVQGETADQAWKSRDFSSYFSTPVAMGSEIYAVTGTPATLKCIDATTGAELWSHGPVGLLYASLLVAKDKLLLQTDTGLLLLVEPNREGYKLLCKAQGCGPGWNHPALADGHLYLRDKAGIKCLRVQP